MFYLSYDNEPMDKQYYLVRTKYNLIWERDYNGQIIVKADKAYPYIRVIGKQLSILSNNPYRR